MSDTYEGWVNRETWTLNLLLSSDQGLYLATLEVVKDATDGYVTSSETYGLTPTDAGRAYAVGEAIVGWFRDGLKEWMTDSAYADMLNSVGSVWRIDHRELGEAWVDDTEFVGRR